MAEKKRTFFIWDTDGEYRDLLPLYAPEELIWMTSDELGLNPLEVPKRQDGRLVMTPDKWINSLRTLLRLLWLNEPSLNLFCELLREEYVKRGIIGGDDGDYPRISDMINVLEQLQVKSNSDRSRARDKVLDRLRSLRQLLPGLDVQCSRDVHRLFGERSVILDVSDLKDIGFQFLFAFMSILRGVVFHSDDPSEITQMEVTEEAHRVLGGHTDARTSDIKESTASGVLRDKRKSKTCAVVVTQLPENLVSSVLGNLGTVFCLRLGDGRNINRAATCVNIEHWQKPELAKLPDRQAIARFSRYGRPVHLAVKDARKLLPGLRPVSREEARRRSAKILEKIPFVEKAEQKPEKPAGPDGLDPESDEYRTFAFVLRKPYVIREDRMEETGMNRDKDWRTVKKLSARGLISSGQKIGSKYKLTQATERGIELARKTGLPVWKGSETGKGIGIAHEAVAHYTRKSLEEFCAGISFPRPVSAHALAGRVADSIAVHPSGRRLALQFCSKNAPPYEASALLDLHGLTLLEPEHPDAVESVAVVAASKSHARNIKEELKSRCGRQIFEGIVILDFDEIVKGGVNWPELFGMDSG